MYHESHGPSLKQARERKRGEDVHHIRIYGHPEGTPEARKWVVEHHSSENDDSPTVHEFDDGQLLLNHLGTHAHANQTGPDRDILPDQVRTEYGRAGEGQS
jgi:hypothetical protein